jgi:hypothetical protein
MKPICDMGELEPKVYETLLNQVPLAFAFTQFTKLEDLLLRQLNFSIASVIEEL